MDPLPPPTGAPVDHPPPPATTSHAPEPEGPAGWQWWQGIVGLLTAVLGSGVAVAILFAISAAFGEDPGDPRGGVAMLGLLVQNIAFVAFVVMFAGLRGGRPAPWMFGLRAPQPGWKQAVGWIAAAYAVLIAVGAFWDVFVDFDDGQITDELGVKANDIAAIAGAALVCVAAPITEELLFRGFLFPALRTKIGVVWAALATGLMFGGVHIYGSPVEALPLLALFGVLLCFVYLKTRSLLPCMVLHSINNVFAYGTLVDWDWQIPILLVVALSLIYGAYRLVEARFGRAPLHLSPV